MRFEEVVFELLEKACSEGMMIIQHCIDNFLCMREEYDEDEDGQC